jgi:hypothetical protein
MTVQDLFVPHLDPAFLGKSFKNCSEEWIPTHDDVKMWFVDFLTPLYHYIAAYMAKYFELDDWESTSVIFAFSVPVAWNGYVVGIFDELIAKAGFGKCNRHSVKLKLTEAEAAVIYDTRGWKLHQISEPSDTSIKGAGMQKDNILLTICNADNSTSVRSLPRSTN